MTVCIWQLLKIFWGEPLETTLGFRHIIPWSDLLVVRTFKDTLQCYCYETRRYGVWAMEMSLNLRVPSGPCDCSSVSFSEKKRPASSIENLFPASLDEQRFLWALMALLCRSQTILSCETCTCYRPLEWCPKPTHTPPWDLSRLYWPWSRETCVCLRNRKLKCF